MKLADLGADPEHLFRWVVTSGSWA